MKTCWRERGREGRRERKREGERRGRKGIERHAYNII